MGLERGPLSLASTIEELLERKSSGFGLESREYGSRDSTRWPGGTLYPQTLALTSPTSGGRSVGIVRSQIQATEFSFSFWYIYIFRLIILHSFDVEVAGTQFPRCELLELSVYYRLIKFLFSSLHLLCFKLASVHSYTHTTIYHIQIQPLTSSCAPLRAWVHSKAKLKRNGDEAFPYSISL
jgi:hypothetical protein